MRGFGSFVAHPPKLHSLHSVVTSSSRQTSGGKLSLSRSAMQRFQIAPLQPHVFDQHVVEV